MSGLAIIRNSSNELTNILLAIGITYAAIGITSLIFSSIIRRLPKNNNSNVYTTWRFI